MYAVLQAMFRYICKQACLMPEPTGDRQIVAVYIVTLDTIPDGQVSRLYSTQSKAESMFT